MRPLLFATTLVAVLAVTLLPGDSAVRAAQGSPLEVLLVLGRSAYQPGEAIGFTVLVRNPSRRPTALSFATSQRFDLFIQSEISLDRWSRGRSFAQALGELRWSPEETIRFSDQWLPRTTLAPGVIGESVERPLGAGVYAMAAELQAIGVRIASRPVFVVIGTPVELAEGCTTFASPFPVELPAAFVAGIVEPSDAIEGLWQQRIAADRYAVFAPQALKPSDLQTVSGSQPLHVCMLAPGRITLPAPRVIPRIE
jgi:Intracellular proteinase inhibitor